MKSQAETLTFAHRVQFRNNPAELLAEEVASVLGSDFGGAAFVNSGSEANELALKIAFMFWAAEGRLEKTNFVTTDNSYHGSTLANIQISGQPRYSASYRPLVRDNQRIRAPYLFRIRVDESINEPDAVVLDRLREDFAKIDHDTTAAVLIETVGGASAAALVPPPGYFELLRKLCDDHQLLWIADEVIAGFARTGAWFGFQHWNAVPDIVSFAKGVSGGFVPLGGVAVSKRIRERVVGHYGAITSGHTYSNNPLTASVGLAVMRVLKRDELVDAATERGEQLARGLVNLARGSRIIVDTRGIGLMRGIEFGDVRTGKPLSPDLNVTARMIELCADEGLIVYPSRGGVDGVTGDALLIAPPVIISKSEIVELLARLERALLRLEAEFIL